MPGWRVRFGRDKPNRQHRHAKLEVKHKLCGAARKTAGKSHSKQISPMITVITRLAVRTALYASQMRSGFAQGAPADRNVP